MATFGDLGERYMDRLHNWSEDREIFTKPIREYQKFIEKTKLKSYETDVAPPMAWLPPTKSQRVALEKVTKFLSQPECEMKMNPLRMLIVGAAGAGKTWLIQRIASAFHAEGRKYLITAPTGPASHLIGGVTLHSAFSVPYLKDSNWEILASKTNPNQKLKDRLRGLELLIIDEVTLLGAGFMHFIDLQLQLCLQNSQPFGQISVILVGDVPSQIPPIGDVALYRNPDNYDDFYKVGIELYRSFKDIVVLKECVRAQFCEDQKTLLKNLKRKKIGASDIKILSRRLEKNVDPDVLRTEFGECLRLFPRRAMCNAYNRQRIAEERMPVIKITAKQIPSTPELTRYEPLILGKGVKLMVTRNLDVNRGITTGAICVCRGILWDKKKNPGTDLPAAVLVEFQNWIPGPKVELNCIPIPPCTDFYHCRVTDRTYKIESFPLRVSYSTTIHGVQGQTLDKACIFLDNCFAENQDYVAISRVRSVDDIVLLDGSLTTDRFRSQSFYKGVASQFAEMKRLGMYEDVVGSDFEDYSDSSETDYDEDSFDEDEPDIEIPVPDTVLNSQLEQFRKDWVSEIDKQLQAPLSTVVTALNEDRKSYKASHDFIKKLVEQETEQKVLKKQIMVDPSEVVKVDLVDISDDKDEGFMDAEDSEPLDLSKNGPLSQEFKPVAESVTNNTLNRDLEPMDTSENVVDCPSAPKIHIQTLPDFLNLGLTEPAHTIIENFFSTPEGEELLKIFEEHLNAAFSKNIPMSSLNNLSGVPDSVWKDLHESDPRLSSSWYNNNNRNLNTPEPLGEVVLPPYSPMAVPSFSPSETFEGITSDFADLADFDEFDQILKDLEAAVAESVETKENSPIVEEKEESIPKRRSLRVRNE